MQQIRLDHDGLEVNIITEVFFDKGSEKYIAESRHLQMSDFGDTEQEAVEMLKAQIKYDLMYMCQEGTIEEFLLSLGWKLVPQKRRSKGMSDLLNCFRISSVGGNNLNRNAKIQQLAF